MSRTSNKPHNNDGPSFGWLVQTRESESMSLARRVAALLPTLTAQVVRSSGSKHFIRRTRKQPEAWEFEDRPDV